MTVRSRFETQERSRSQRCALPVFGDFTQPKNGSENSILWIEEGAMREYEIRVLSSGHATMIIEESHLSDHAAVRSARKYAADRPFEVWRGNDCIYSPPEPPRTPAEFGRGLRR